MIHIQSLYKTIDQQALLSDISLHINKGEFALIHGTSGSGKTTLLHIIASFMQPTSGKIIVNNEDIARLSDIFASTYRQHTIGYITQNFYLLEELSVEQNLLPALLYNTQIATDEHATYIAKALKHAQIEHKAKQKVATLSGGEKQRVLIARAIVNNPPIILCDEPTANLDKTNSLAFIETLLSLKSDNKTIVVATHDPLFENLNSIDQSLQLLHGKLHTQG